MIKKASPQPTVVRTARGLSIAGTRITIYNVMDYLKAGWTSTLIQDRLNLSDKQIADVMDYIETHRQEVEAEYELVLQRAEEIRQYWKKRNRQRFSIIAGAPPPDGQEKIRAKLQALKAKLNSV